MPTLKMHISGELVDSLTISFEGMNSAEERTQHAEGLAQWLRHKNEVTTESDYEIFIDGMETKVNKICERYRYDELYRESLKKKRKSFKVIATTKELEQTKQPFVRPKADHTNKNWWDE